MKMRAFLADNEAPARLNISTSLWLTPEGHLEEGQPNSLRTSFMFNDLEHDSMNRRTDRL